MIVLKATWKYLMSDAIRIELESLHNHKQDFEVTDLLLCKHSNVSHISAALVLRNQYQCHIP